MHHFFICTLVLLVLPFVLSAPTALDTSILLQNGVAAQQLNTKFLSLKATDACNSSEIACISGLAARCSRKGAWETKKCSGGKERSCFALPSVRNNGTFLSCTSEASAISVITATGAQGGLTGNSSTASSSSESSPTTVKKATTITVTIELPPGSSVILPPATRTIGPSEASSILSSLAVGTALSASAPEPSSAPTNTIEATRIQLISSTSTALLYH